MGINQILIRLLILLLVCTYWCCQDSGTSNKTSNNKIRVVVSIVPQKTFVKEIAGNRVSVNVMVKPGWNPATYEPTPVQLVELSRAHIYFRIGVPFENIWMERIQQANPSMKIIDIHKGVVYRPMETALTNDLTPPVNRNTGAASMDPHIWLDPTRIKHVVRNICNAFLEQDPDHAGLYKKNLEQVLEKLDKLDSNINKILKQCSKKKILVFHPSWGYFTSRYGLVQIPVEMEGKETVSRNLVRIIEMAKKDGIKTIFVQKQFSSKQAELISHAINGKVITVDPLAENYYENLVHVARIFRESCS